MDQLAAGDRATVKFISEELEEDNELLGYLDRHNIKPGCAITVGEKVPSTGVLTISTPEEPVSLSLAVASRIRVARAADSPPRST
jgi:hypothetical protein